MGVFLEQQRLEEGAVCVYACECVCEKERGGDGEKRERERGEREGVGSRNREGQPCACDNPTRSAKPTPGLL